MMLLSTPLFPRPLRPGAAPARLAALLVVGLLLQAGEGRALEIRVLEDVRSVEAWAQISDAIDVDRHTAPSDLPYERLAEATQNGAVDWAAAGSAYQISQMGADRFYALGRAKAEASTGLIGDPQPGDPPSVSGGRGESRVSILFAIDEPARFTLAGHLAAGLAEDGLAGARVTLYDLGAALSVVDEEIEPPLGYRPIHLEGLLEAGTYDFEVVAGAFVSLSDEQVGDELASDFEMQLTFQPLPEPPTWLALAGGGLAALAARRQGQPKRGAKA